MAGVRDCEDICYALACCSACGAVRWPVACVHGRAARILCRLWRALLHPRSSAQVTKDWENREVVEVVRMNVLSLTNFLTQFGA